MLLQHSGRKLKPQAGGVIRFDSALNDSNRLPAGSDSQPPGKKVMTLNGAENPSAAPENYFSVVLGE